MKPLPYQRLSSHDQCQLVVIPDVASECWIRVSSTLQGDHTMDSEASSPDWPQVLVVGDEHFKANWSPPPCC
jgi:hypothetical protein